MRIIAFILDPPVIERILLHVGEPVEPPVILPARAPPQAEMDYGQEAPGRMSGRTWIRRPVRAATPGDESRSRTGLAQESANGKEGGPGVGVSSSGSKTGNDRGSMRFGPEIGGLD